MSDYKRADIKQKILETEGKQEFGVTSRSELIKNAEKALEIENSSRPQATNTEGVESQPALKSKGAADGKNSANTTQNQEAVNANQARLTMSPGSGRKKDKRNEQKFHPTPKV